MSGSGLPGSVVTEVISVRFAYSGQISSIYKHPGDLVNVGDHLASLDQKTLQAELDRELADYERIRADFELFTRRQGEPQNDTEKFEKIRQQSHLTVSVKAVELVKYRLDQAVLKSPIRGQITSMGNLRSGLFITPGANPVEILDLDSIYFQVSSSWKTYAQLLATSPVQVELTDLNQTISASVMPFIPPTDPKKPPQVCFKLETDLPLYSGMSGRVIVPHKSD